MKAFPFISLPAAALLLAGAGCATSSPSPATSGRSSAGYGESGYAWHDPFFYEPWYDPAAIVLPPPRPGAAVSGVRAAPAASDPADLRELDYH